MLQSAGRGHSESVSRLLKDLEDQGVNRLSLKPRPRTRDFARENISKLRQIQLTNRTTERQQTPHKSKYQNVPSKVAAYINKNEPNRIVDVKKLKVKEPKMVEATTLKTPLSISGTSCPGEIPKYLTERKLSWKKAKEEELKSAQAAAIPAGHILIEEDERLEMLENLKTNVAELYNELATLPITVTTLKMRKRKEDIEAKIVEGEEAIAIFSKLKVFISKKD